MIVNILCSYLCVVSLAKIAYRNIFYLYNTDKKLYLLEHYLLSIFIIIIIMVIFKCYFSGEHIALSIKNNNNGVNIQLGKTNRLKALCMMQINT